MNFLNLNLKSFLKIFLVSSVPLVSWSSSKPNNLKPSIKTFTILCMGLFIFGLGESILVVSQYGVTPWTVLAEGFAKKIDIGIGLSTFIVSVIVLFLWLPLKLKPGLGTVMNIFIIAMTMGSTIPFLYFLNNFFNGLFLSFLGTFIVGFGSGIYLIANLGPGTRDGLMTGISKKYNNTLGNDLGCSCNIFMRQIRGGSVHNWCTCWKFHKCLKITGICPQALSSHLKLIIVKK